jgi:hypothetical protein
MESLLGVKNIKEEPDHVLSISIHRHHECRWLSIFVKRIPLAKTPG